MTLALKQISVTVQEALPLSPHLSRWNTYHYAVWELSEPTWVTVKGEPILIVGLEWDSAGLSQLLVAENGIRLKPGMVDKNEL